MNFLPPRIIALAIALGLSLVAFGGASLASASSGALERSGSDSTGRTDNPSDDGGNAGEFGSGGNAPAGGDTTPGGAALPSADSAAKGSGSQAAALPFTGYIAIPVLLIGVVMLGTGFMLHRRSV